MSFVTEIELLSLEARRVSDRIWELGVTMTDDEFNQESDHLARVCEQADALISRHDAREVVKARLDRARQAIAGPRQQPLYFSKLGQGGEEAISRVLMSDRDARA